MHVRLDTITQALDRAGLLADRRGSLPDVVTGMTDDSRAVRPGALFVAVKGTERDGHEFLPAAAQSGASVAIVERAGTTSLPALIVKDRRRAAALCEDVRRTIRHGPLRADALQRLADKDNAQTVAQAIAYAEEALREAAGDHRREPPCERGDQGCVMRRLSQANL